MKSKLRIGLLIDDYSVPSWMHKMITNINDSEHSKIVLIVKKKTIPKKKQSTISKIWEHRNTLAYLLFVKLDEKIFKTGDNAFKLESIKKTIICEEIEVSAEETKLSDFISREDINKIKPYNIDVFIRLGFRILRGEILNVSKYGIWSFHHGDNTVNRGGPAGVWEVIKNWNQTGVTLQILSEDLDGGLKLDESFSSTDKVSFFRNKNNYFFKSSLMLPRKLNQLHQLGEDEFFKNIHEFNKPHFYYNPLFRAPSNTIIFKTFFNIYIKKILSIIESFFFTEQWILLFKLENSSKLSTSFFRFKKILPPKDRFWADPFVIEKNDNYYIFIEELIYKENKGKISVIEMNEDGNYSSPKIVLEKDYHLSYPFLFKDNDNLYMIPETQQNKTIELYKCCDFPLKWEFCMNLMIDVQALDTTIIKRDNKYWLFTNMKENEGVNGNDELFLFYSDHLNNDEWTYHPSNPIVSDVTKSRSAGEIFSVNNKLYRPSQNCAKRYGHGITINEIIELNENSYLEKTVQKTYPNWERDIKAVHTINHTQRLTVIDGVLRRKK
jgi:hypothetical protein